MPTRGRDPLTRTPDAQTPKGGRIAAAVAPISQPTPARLLVRTWNVFHGNTSPTGHTRDLEQIVRLAVADADVALLQEVPVFALPRLEAWSGYTVFGAVAARPRVPGDIAGRITDLAPGLLRSAVEGQANAILVAPHLAATDHTQLVLNPRRFRHREAERLRLPLRARLAWARERRVAHAVRLILPDAKSAVVANFHATSYRMDKRIADVEVLRAAAFADALAAREEALILGGDFNVTVVSSPVLRALSTSEWGFSSPGPGLDHVLVRGLEVETPEARWSDDRRRAGSRLLSDHAPVEIKVRERAS